MMVKANPRMDQVLAELIGQSSRPERKRNLRVIHEICAVQASTSGDLSLATIGRLSEAAGGVSARALYNAASAPYQLLITAWMTDVGDKTAAPRIKPGYSDAVAQVLSTVTSAAARALIQRAFVERDRYKAELNLLKGATLLKVDRRVLPASEQPSRTNVALTESQRLALKRSIDPAFWAQVGWREGPGGSILTTNSRVIHDVGFITGIRRVLAADSRGYGQVDGQVDKR